MDVRRDVLIVSARKLEEGIIQGRVRTTNVLYVTENLMSQPEFGPVEELRIAQMWKWTGQPWGGLEDGTSLVDRLEKQPEERKRNS